MTSYNQPRISIAVNCIIFGFDGQQLKLLLVQSNHENERNRWGLMSGNIENEEDPEKAAHRILKQLTGLEDVYMEQLHFFGEIQSASLDRTMSLAYYALIDIHRCQQQLSRYRAEWFTLKDRPQLIFDHDSEVEMAREKLRYKAALHPVLFELLPEKFTIPQIQLLYESVYDTILDKRNFSRKLLSTGLIIKQPEKNKATSKKGAYYYKLDPRIYKEKFAAFLNFIPNPGILIEEEY